MNLMKTLMPAALLLVLAGPLAADDLETVLAGYETAIGGAERWAAVEAMTVTGDYTSFSLTFPFTIHRKRTLHYRFDHHLNSRPVVVAYDGAKAWQVHPFYGSEDPMVVPNNDSLVIRRDAAIDPVLLNPAAHGHQATLLEAGEVDGTPVYRIEVVRADSSREIWSLDRETFLPVMMTGSTYDFGGEVSLLTFFDDYREVDGVVLPFYVELEFGMRSRVYGVDAVTINPELPDSLFVMP